jgi:hypothetical protein
VIGVSGVGQTAHGCGWFVAVVPNTIVVANHFSVRGMLCPAGESLRGISDWGIPKEPSQGAAIHPPHSLSNRHSPAGHLGISNLFLQWVGLFRWLPRIGPGMARSRRKREAPPERRSAFRFPVSGPRRNGRLQVGECEFAVDVVDESAGGFAIEFTHLADCHVGDMLMLRVADDWFKVRIAFLEMQDVGVERFTGCDLKSHTRLGLMRISDEEGWALKRKKGKRHLFRFRRPRVYVRKNALVAAAISIVVGLIVFGGALIRTLDRSKPLDPFSDDGSGTVVANIKKPLVLAPKTGLPSEGDIRKHLRSIEADDQPTPTQAGSKPGTVKTASRPERPEKEKPERKYRAPKMPSLPAGLLKEPANAAESAVDSAVRAAGLSAAARHLEQARPESYATSSLAAHTRRAPHGRSVVV